MARELGAYLVDFFKTLAPAAVSAATGSTAVLIDERRHPLVRWVIPPERGTYKRADFEPILAEVDRVRGGNEPLVIVVEAAELLRDGCASALLKVLEEPPVGIYFFLCTPERDFVLSTIASRAIMVDKRAPNIRKDDNELTRLWCRPTPPKLVELAAFFDQYKKLDEQQVGSLLDELVVFWQNVHKNALLEGDEDVAARAERALGIVQRLGERPPMPGSARFFWRNMAMFLMR